METPLPRTLTLTTLKMILKMKATESVFDQLKQKCGVHKDMGKATLITFLNEF